MSLVEEPIPAREIINIDGYIVDDAGEVLGLASVGDDFVPDTTEKVEWVLERMADEEALLLARKAVTAAALANLKARERPHEARLAWLKRRYGMAIIDHARASLDGQKGRTIQFDHGKVSFRTTPGTNDIIDMKAAVEFVESVAPAMVRKEVTVTDVLKAAKAFEEIFGDKPTLREVLASSGPGESVTISTGIKGK